MISIVMPVYNEGEALVDRLVELFAGHAIEQCVVVDASNAEMVSRVQILLAERLADPRLIYVVAEVKGRASQMNQGAQVSGGNMLLFLHADTQLPEKALSKVQKGLGEGWHWGRFDVCFDQSGWSYRVIAGMMNWRSRKSGIATGDQAMFMSRAAFDLVDHFDEIELMEDVAMSKKLKSFGQPLCLDEKVTTSARRWEQKGVLRTVLLMWWLRLAYFFGVAPDKLASRYQ